MKLIRIGVDLAKNVFQIHGVDRFEKPIWRKKLRRGDWLNAVLERIEPGCESVWKHARAPTTGPGNCKSMATR